MFRTVFPSGPSDSLFDQDFFVFSVAEKVFFAHAHFFAKDVGSAGFEPTTLVLPTTPYVKARPVSHSSEKITIYQSEELA